MPTYTISAPAGRLTGTQKSQLAREVTRAHPQQTGAQTFFAQVMFVDVPASNWFVGGSPQCHNPWRNDPKASMPSTSARFLVRFIPDPLRDRFAGVSRA